jgi:hypothetical protein
MRTHVLSFLAPSSPMAPARRRPVLGAAILLATTTLAIGAAAQTAVFPPDYGNVPEGPFNSQQLPLAYGTSRVQMVFDTVSMSVPVGRQISAIGWREDGQVPTMNPGRSLQLEVRVGYTTHTAATLTGTFDNHFAAPPTTVFGPALFVLPNLRDPNAPLPNGRFNLPITPFTFAPPTGQNLLVEFRVFGTSGGGTPFTYFLDRADYVSPVVSGPAGCAHTTGTSVLTMQPTRPGQYFDASVATGPAISPCVLALGIGSTLASPYPLTGVFAGISPTCLGQILPTQLDTLGGTTSGSGTTSWQFFIPNQIDLSGLPIAGQALFLDFFSPGGIVVSNGSQVTLGTNPRATIVYANQPPTTAVNGQVARNYAPVTFFTHN